MSDKYKIGEIELASTANLEDAEALMTMLGQRWNLEAYLDLSRGCIEVWRDDANTPGGDGE